VRIEPLGDQALLAYCDNEDDAARLAAHVRLAQPIWCIDVVQAYLSVAIYYDIAACDINDVADWLVAHPLDAAMTESLVGPLHVIPCCYEMGLDFDRLESHLGIERDAIINLHAGTIYTVYAIGFCPGFPYLGYLPQVLTGVPRLESPRLKVEAGSVGMTGRQTGIYTEARPGGWNIIGRTPLQLVDVVAGYFPLRTGDRVQFQRIDERAYRELEGKRLP
jgi:inhibitor of KinA